MNSGTLSDLLGWTSIACWLGAQFPQVLENARRRSCEGLALPFLLNWLLGDITNLVGCILTHQLPFQTILATYFVSVDFTLFSQYFYYKWQAPKASSPRLLEPTATPRHSYSRRPTLEQEHYRELSDAAANVAIAAALAASQEDLHTYGYHQAGKREGGPSVTRSEAAEVEDEVDDDALAALADSFHSESGRKRVSWSQERHGMSGRGGRGGSSSRQRQGTVSPLITMRSSLILSSPTIETSVEHAAEFDPSSRGRPRERQVIDSPMDDDDLEGQEGTLRRTVSKGTLKERRSSRASSKAVGLVFLGAWALFGIGSTATSSRTLRSLTPASSLGVVLSETETTPPRFHLDDAIPTIDNHVHTLLEPTFEIASIPPIDETPYYASTSETPTTERVIGRIFAWMCTTLYLTSRLPQIWKNFSRKSVEGLSIFMFIFAFLGNTFYVLSILTSPKMSQPRPDAKAFLLESIPYLLGSGGTLMFDVTIVFQSIIYRRNPRFSRRRSSTQSSSRGQHAHLHTGRSSKVGSLARRGRSLSAARVATLSRSHGTSLPEEAAPLLAADENAIMIVQNQGIVDSTRGHDADWTRGSAQNRRRKETGGHDRAETSPS